MEVVAEGGWLVTVVGEVVVLLQPANPRVSTTAGTVFLNSRAYTESAHADFPLSGGPIMTLMGGVRMSA